MAARKRKKKIVNHAPEEVRPSSRKDIIYDSILVIFVAVLIGLAWQLYPDLSALVRRLIFLASIIIGIGVVVLRTKEIIK